MQIIEDRRALHRIPEPDFRLPKTIAYLKNALEGLGCKVFAPIDNALCAWFDFGAERTIAFRADMDALPIQENTGLPFASEHDGYMHACGHDGHMAIALEVCRRLSAKEENPNNVLMVFQPAEETIGGAKPLCQSGVFQKCGVEAVFGLHVWPALEAGILHTRKGPMMSRVSEITVEIKGRPAHIGKAWEAVDALAAGVEFYSKVRAFEKELDPSVQRILNFGKMQSGSVRNIISGTTRLEGSLRAYSDEVFEYLRDTLLAIGKEVEQSTGCTVIVDLSEGYPAVTNDGKLVEKIRPLVAFKELEEPTMISEDFSFYQKAVPGVFFFLGLGDTPALHNDKFDFDESILLKGADFLAQLAEKYQ
jgi:hippurate hydrolase